MLPMPKSEDVAAEVQANSFPNFPVFRLQQLGREKAALEEEDGFMEILFSIVRRIIL